VATRVCEYVTVTSPVGSGDVVAIVRVATIVNANALLVVTPVASVNCTVKLKVPAMLGIPAIVPVVVDSDSPAGKLPLEIVQV
jgi:hypothetical protein